MAGEKSDAAQVKAFLNGDRVAYKQIEEIIAVALAVWRGKFGYQTDDIKSDIIYKLLISLRRGDFQYKSTLKTYISRIVSHTCIDYYRFNKRSSPVDIDEIQLPDKKPTPEEETEKQQMMRLTFRVLRLVSKECRKLWRMYLKQDLNYRQIGEILNKTEGNIRRQMWVCRESAKKIRENILKKDKHI